MGQKMTKPRGNSQRQLNKEVSVLRLASRDEKVIQNFQQHFE